MSHLLDIQKLYDNSQILTSNIVCTKLTYFEFLNRK